MVVGEALGVKCNRILASVILSSFQGLQEICQCWHDEIAALPALLLQYIYSNILHC